MMLTPRSQTQQIGHQDIEQELITAWSKGHLHHSMMFVGPKGVGKATMAFRLAKFLFSNPAKTAESLSIDASAPVFRRVVSGGHGDLLVVEPQTTDTITVEGIRTVSKFLSQTPMEGGWRIVIIDGEMNRNAANALLKTLEEPPKKSLVIVITESAGRLVPTIRSRCRIVDFSPLTDDQVRSVLGAANAGIDGEQLQTLITLADGSPGRALELYEVGGVELYQNLLSLLGQLSPPSYTRLLEFCQKYGAKPAKTSVDLFPLLGSLLSGLLYKMIKGDDKTLEQLKASRPLAEWSLAWQQINDDFRKAQNFHLDRTQVLMNAFSKIAS